MLIHDDFTYYAMRHAFRHCCHMLSFRRRHCLLMITLYSDARHYDVTLR